MGIYLKKFDTHTEYENYINGSGAILPNVSICEDTKDVHYNIDPYNGHEYVEIGGLKWATMNIGANSITDYGLYFQWGDVQGYTADQVSGSSTPHKGFTWADYKYCSGAGTSSSAMTKYNATDGKTLLEASDDAAQVNWGGAWRMPTGAEFQALRNAVNAVWTADYQGSGVARMVLTDKTDSSKTLFFPSAGFCSTSSVVNGREGYYWSSSLYTDGPQYAFYLRFFNQGSHYDPFNRCCGQFVRGVAS